MRAELEKNMALAHERVNYLKPFNRFRATESKIRTGNKVLSHHMPEM